MCCFPKTPSPLSASLRTLLTSGIPPRYFCFMKSWLYKTWSTLFSTHLIAVACSATAALCEKQCFRQGYRPILWHLGHVNAGLLILVMSLHGRVTGPAWKSASLAICCSQTQQGCACRRALQCTASLRLYLANLFRLCASGAGARRPSTCH